MNEQTLTRYLLGALPEDEQAKIEERLFTDDECFQQLQALQAELADNYVRGNLSAAERLQYERRFLNTATGRADTLFARALTQVLEDESAATPAPVLPEPKPSFWESITAFFTVPAFGLGVAATCLVLLTLGGLWFYQESQRLRGEVEQANIARANAETEAQKQQQLQDEIARAKARNDELNNQLQQVQEERDQARQELEKAATQSAAASGSANTLLSFLLVPGLVRGDNERTPITVPASTGRLRIQLDLDQYDQYSNYRAELHTRSGKLIYRRGQLSARDTAAGKAVFLEVPAKVLSSGDYDVILQGLNAAGELADPNYYHFKVERK